MRRGDELVVTAERANLGGCSGVEVVENGVALVRIPLPGGPVTLQPDTVGTGCD